MSEDVPEAANGMGGESDVVAERSGAETPRAPRPIPADPVDPPDIVLERMAEERRAAPEEEEATTEDEPSG